MRFGTLTILLAALTLPELAHAQDSTPPKPDASTPVQLEKKAWIGISVSPAPAALRHQLKTPDGIGLVIEFVQPKSPADETGLKPFDLLVKLDDQWLVNP